MTGRQFVDTSAFACAFDGAAPAKQLAAQQVLEDARTESTVVSAQVLDGFSDRDAEDGPSA